MTKRNFANTFFMIATTLVVVFTISFSIYEYRREHAFRVDILHSQLQLNNYKQILSPTLPLYGEGADSTYRLTIIDIRGNVIYDSRETNVRKMGNHLHRKEIQDALRLGSGYDIKRATSLPTGGERGAGETYFYSATYFKHLPYGDGTEGGFVRSAVPYSAPLTASLERDYTFFYYAAGILALVAIVLYFRSRLTHSENEKQRIKRQLTENAAHELKTPAATIGGYLETLVENPTMSEEKRNEFIARCYTQSKRMNSLLLDMSTLTQLDEANLTRPTTIIDAAKILRQIVEETSAQFKERNIEVRMTFASNQLPLQGDLSLIYSLFRNIFSNTLAYATNATCFEIKARRTKDGYVFLFIDNGVGVSSEHLPHLFERFYRTDKGRSRRLGGTGLGLAIVKNIAVRYGGYATAATTPGGGLTIEIGISK